MTVVTVSQVNTYIKALLDEAAPLNNIYIVGEISNFLHYYRSGHMYFTLKDESSQIKAVMFSTYASRLKFQVEDGMRVVCRGRVSTYEKDGVYQIFVEDMQPDGIGALNLAYEQLKVKLSKEGLFDDIYKKPIPTYPKKIGVATSNVGAAVEDIKKITARRYPLAQLVIVPTVVQGEKASADIVKSINFLDSIDDIDVIIVGRGGGSLEDLWAFNTEEVARAVFNCSKPIISAVGHETDFTICDFVADVRASTPSAAAEIAVPDIRNLSLYLDNVTNIMQQNLKYKIDSCSLKLDSLTRDGILFSYSEYFKNLFGIINNSRVALINTYNSLIKQKSEKLSREIDKLNALSPLAVLKRGFTVAVKDNAVVKNASDICAGDKINLMFNDGVAQCSVDEVTK